MRFGQAQCLYVSVKDIARALFQLGYLRSHLHGTYDDETAQAFGEWYDSSGIDSFFGLQVSAVDGSVLVSVCPAEAWTQLEAQAQLDAQEQEGPVAAPDSSIPTVPTTVIEPLGPPQGEVAPPPRAEAGTMSVGWLFAMGLGAGFGTWLLLRKVY